MSEPATGYCCHQELGRWARPTQHRLSRSSRLMHMQCLLPTGRPSVVSSTHHSSSAAISRRRVPRKHGSVPTSSSVGRPLSSIIARLTIRAPRRLTSHSPNRRGASRSPPLPTTCKIAPVESVSPYLTGKNPDEAMRLAARSPIPHLTNQ
ncbi:hypothetical protein DAEQUDRAFT_734223 [Daedalea quercina L-15889]|uniref:Uncharacterized protein n=1 Tax=Daedalea quercina L-15889 TaxID=1314783 RepID=A0A165KFY0_9APHY|nr:hypothetical protein DAEQUDRAFT_734223 [Daedalea quercina L-15889]